MSTFATVHAAAQVLSSVFPEGVPGYDTQPGVTVLSRKRPELEPLGVQAGGFILRPALETAFGYDDNVLGGTPRRGSWVASTRPSMVIGSTWSRHAAGLQVSLNDTRYLDAPAQSRTDGSVSIGGAVDIGRDRLTLSAAHVAAHQDRTQLDALPTDAPVPIQVDDVRASYAASFGRWTWTPQIQASRWRFGDTTILGVPASQGYRDRDVLRGGATLRYDVAPLRGLVLVARATRQHYTHTPPGQIRPDSTGFQLLAGIDYDDNSVWRYRLLLGGETRSFAASALQPHSALVAEAEVTWNPSGLTTVRATLTRGIEDAAQEGVSGLTYTGVRLTVDHEYQRDVILSASAGLRQAEFLQNGGTQWGWSAGLGVMWLVNRSVRLSATYDVAGLKSTGVSPGLLSGDAIRGLGLLTLRLGL